MVIIFCERKFEKVCNAFAELQKRHGVQRAKLIRRRLDDIRAANNLEELRNAPGRYHELVNRDYEISVDLDGPYRLIFTPANTPAPLTPEGGLNWRDVTGVKILRIEDTHD